jgi:hypothetical protein
MGTKGGSDINLYVKNVERTVIGIIGIDDDFMNNVTS